MVQDLPKSVVALLHVSLGLLVLRARPNAVNQAFAARIVGLCWVGSRNCWPNQSDSTLDYSVAFSFAFASLVPTAFLFFSHCYPLTNNWVAPPFARFAFCLSALLRGLVIGHGSAVVRRQAYCG